MHIQAGRWSQPNQGMKSLVFCKWTKVKRVQERHYSVKGDEEVDWGFDDPVNEVDKEIEILADATMSRIQGCKYKLGDGVKQPNQDMKSLVFCKWTKVKRVQQPHYSVKGDEEVDWGFDDLVNEVNKEIQIAIMDIDKQVCLEASEDGKEGDAKEALDLMGECKLMWCMKNIFWYMMKLKSIVKSCHVSPYAGPHHVCSALDYVKLQRGPSQHASASRITIRLALKLAGKPYDLPAKSNAKRITKRLADGCSKDPCCVLSALDYVNLHRGPFEHPSASRITIQLAFELAGKPYDFLARSNAKRITKRLAYGCLEDPCCVLSALDYVKLHCGPFEHPSANRITIYLALELAGKPYDLPANSTASRLTIRLADGCLEGLRCIFSALNYVKLQRGPFEHPSLSRITIRLALELASKSYDLPASSNARRITKRQEEVQGLLLIN
ncbi:hypothetical protein L7F22_058171 [Adiantum nelumboides]|nr:hypothetical protein [Adiantum nelumboides]